MRGSAILLGALVGLLAIGRAPDVRAQNTPPTAAAQQLADPAALPVRGANFAWDHDLLRASFSFKDVADPATPSGQAVRNRLSNGLTNTIVMRAYVFEDGSNAPVALAARTCSVAYDLWEEVYRVKIEDSSGVGLRVKEVINMDGVVRQCLVAQDFPITARANLKKGKSHFLGVIVEVDPIGEQMLQQIRQWVSRPTGATQLTAGDALFGAFVGIFTRQIGSADVTAVGRSPAFVP